MEPSKEPMDADSTTIYIIASSLGATVLFILPWIVYCTPCLGLIAQLISKVPNNIIILFVIS